jgi:hypothetical protein
VIGCWPRGESYFRRNDWAGRWQRDGRWIMDSPAANALSHFLHLPLYLLGHSMDEAAVPAAVAAELYRANDIENYDTCSIRITLGGQLPLVVAYTHACHTTVEPLVTIETERAQIRYFSYRHIEIRTADSCEKLSLCDQPHRHMLSAFKARFDDSTGAPAGATLEMSLAQVMAVNAASESAPVIDVPREFVHPVHDSEDNIVRTIRNIVPALEACAQRGCLIHETGLAPWAHAPKPFALKDYRHFRGPHQMHQPSLAMEKLGVDVTIPRRRQPMKA